MLRSDATGMRPVIQADSISSISPASTPSQEAFNRLMQVSIGKQFQAEVLLRQNDGTYLVRIADTTARMALPESANSGDQLSMKLLAAHPRPTFLLGETTVSTLPLPLQQRTTGTLIDTLTQGAATDSAGQVGRTAGTEAAVQTGIASAEAGATSSTPTSLSSAGRMIDALLQASPQGHAPSSISGQTAIVPSPDVPSTKLAQAMHETLEFSGLFYESHVGEWVEGKRPAEALLREPQAQLKQGLTETSDAQQQTPTTATNNEAANLMRMQLEVLENRRFAWQGELWPGQQFEWEVTDESPQQQDSPEAPQTWRSVMRFELPTLGAVSASVLLSGGHVQVQLRTTSENAALTIRSYTGALASALEAAGSPLDLLTVKQDESE